MASSPEFVVFIAGQLKESGDILCRKMFGEYGIYRNGKIFGLICDDTLFIKITDAGKNIDPPLPEAPPYEGSKNYYLIEDVENREFLTEFVVETCKYLPEPKPKRGK